MLLRSNMSIPSGGGRRLPPEVGEWVKVRNCPAGDIPDTFGLHPIWEDLRGKILLVTRVTHNNQSLPALPHRHWWIRAEKCPYALLGCMLEPAGEGWLFEEEESGGQDV